MCQNPAGEDLQSVSLLKTALQLMSIMFPLSYLFLVAIPYSILADSFYVRAIRLYIFAIGFAGIAASSL
jgi:hypothetical protein